jgi:hypothetical protein
MFGKRLCRFVKSLFLFIIRSFEEYLYSSNIFFLIGAFYVVFCDGLPVVTVQSTIIGAERRGFDPSSVRQFLSESAKSRPGGHSRVVAVSCEFETAKCCDEAGVRSVLNKDMMNLHGVFFVYRLLCVCKRMCT